MTHLRIRLLVGTVIAVLAAFVAVVLPPLGGAPAGATHPCASSSAAASPSPSPSPGETPRPPDRYYHPACGGDAEAPLAADVTVSSDANGSTVHLTVGQRLGVRLYSPFEAKPEQTWTDIDAGDALYRTRLYVGGYETDAVFVAERTSAGEVVTATADALCRHQDSPCPLTLPTWSVTVVVDAPAASPTAGSAGQPCYGYPPSGSLRVELQAADNGRTVQVTQGDVIGVYLGGNCPAGGGYRPATATGPLFRAGVDEYQPGATFAGFRAVGTGSTSITATTDAPCLHTSPACAIPQALWSVTIVIVPIPCTFTGPTSVRSGSDVPLVGTAPPGASVQVWFRQRGAASFVVRRSLTADGDGRYTTTYRANDDYRWYATSGDCSSAAGLTRVTSWTSGPRYALRRSVVPIAVRGPAGAAVALYMREPGGAFHLEMTGQLDASGSWRTSYVALADQRYYAVTGPDHRTSEQVLTQLR